MSLQLEALQSSVQPHPARGTFQKNQKPIPSRSHVLPQTRKPTRSPGTLSNHRPKREKFILTSNDAFVLNFRRAVSLQTCSFPATRRKGRRSILAFALGILRQFTGQPRASAPSLHPHSQRHSLLPGIPRASWVGAPGSHPSWQWA